MASIGGARRLPSTLGRTFIVAALGICALYFAGVLAAAPLCGPAITPWFLAGWSATFVWLYLAFTRGRPVGALVIAAIVTVVLPVVALFAMVWPIYGSPSSVSALWSEFRARGLLGGVELFAPLLAAGVATFLISRNNFNAKPT